MTQYRIKNLKNDSAQNVRIYQVSATGLIDPAASFTVTDEFGKSVGVGLLKAYNVDKEGGLNRSGILQFNTDDAFTVTLPTGEVLEAPDLASFIIILEDKGFVVTTMEDYVEPEPSVCVAKLEAPYIDYTFDEGDVPKIEWSINGESFSYTPDAGTEVTSAMVLLAYFIQAQDPNFFDTLEIGTAFTPESVLLLSVANKTDTDVTVTVNVKRDASDSSIFTLEGLLCAKVALNYIVTTNVGTCHDGFYVRSVQKSVDGVTTYGVEVLDTFEENAEFKSGTGFETVSPVGGDIKVVKMGDSVVGTLSQYQGSGNNVLLGRLNATGGMDPITWENLPYTHTLDISKDGTLVSWCEAGSSIFSVARIGQTSVTAVKTITIPGNPTLIKTWISPKKNFIVVYATKPNGNDGVNVVTYIYTISNGVVGDTALSTTGPISGVGLPIDDGINPETVMSPFYLDSTNDYFLMIVGGSKHNYFTVNTSNGVFEVVTKTQNEIPYIPVGVIFNNDRYLLHFHGDDTNTMVELIKYNPTTRELYDGFYISKLIPFETPLLNGAANGIINLVQQGADSTDNKVTIGVPKLTGVIDTNAFYYDILFFTIDEQADVVNTKTYSGLKTL